MRADSWATLLAVVTVAGCESAARPELVVDLRTDLVPGVEFSAVRIDVVDSGGASRSESVPSFVGEDFVRARRIAEVDRLREGTASLRVTLADDTGAPVLVRDSTVDLDGRVSVLVVLARDCRGVTCADPARPACVAGQCVPEECALGSLEECGEAECAADSECAAPAGGCARVTCADGACLATSTTGACGATEWCSPEDGCRPLPSIEMPDAGPSDAGLLPFDGGPPMDAGVRDAGPSPDGGPRPDAGAPDGGSCTLGAMGWECSCPAGMTCVFPCMEGVGGCHAECAASTDCTLNCGMERDCSMTCQAPSECTPACPVGMCVRAACLFACTYTCVGCDGGI